MSENKVELKDIYDDAILQGSTDGAEIIKRCGAKVRIDGSTELMIRHLAAKKLTGWQKSFKKAVKNSL